MRTRTYRTLVSFGGGIGLITALFAAAEFLSPGLSAVCSPTSYVSCGAVLSSGLTTIFGIQDWVWGIAGFVAILVVGALAELHRRDARYAYLLLAVTTGGVAVAAYLLYVELVEIRAICPVCVSAYACGVVAWAGAIGLARRAYRRPNPGPEEGIPDP